MPCWMPLPRPPDVTEKLKISTSGQGPELLLLHGWAMHSGIWGGLVDSLSSEFHVNLVDLPGHGLTVVPDDYPLSAEGMADFVDRFRRITRAIVARDRATIAEQAVAIGYLPADAPPGDGLDCGELPVSRGLVAPRPRAAKMAGNTPDPLSAVLQVDSMG